MRGVDAIFPRALECNGDFTEESGFTAGRALSELAPRPTAVFAANDSMAVGVLASLAKAGIKVPEGMSVVGFDDIPIARYVNPPLTTMRVDMAELGRRAFGLLLDGISRPVLREARHDRVAASLVVRNSCAAPSTETKFNTTPHRAARGQKRGPEKGEVL
jgi:LacI family transcriptional regulator